MADFTKQHARGKFQLHQRMQTDRADRDPGDGVYRIRPLYDASVVVGFQTVPIRSTVAYDDPHMIALIQENEIPFRVVSQPVAVPVLVPVAVVKRKPHSKEMPLP